VGSALHKSALIYRCQHRTGQGSRPAAVKEVGDRGAQRLQLAEQSIAARASCAVGPDGHRARGDEILVGRLTASLQVMVSGHAARFIPRLIRARRKPFVTIVFSHSAPIMHHLVTQLQIAPR
jgi:hypothetical protein